MHRCGIEAELRTGDDGAGIPAAALSGVFSQHRATAGARKGNWEWDLPSSAIGRRPT